MTKRDVVLDALGFRRPAYVPWAWGPTKDCAARLKKYLGKEDLTDWIDSHFAGFGREYGRFFPADRPGHVRDIYGVLWDRTVDKDIGTPVEWPIRRPEDLNSYRWPDPADECWYAGIAEGVRRKSHLFRRYELGFSLYERAWTMRGMSDLLMDMVERPAFIERFLDTIVEHNLVQIRRALELGVDAVYFGDDYGMQTGLIMGIDHWRRFIKPRLARMFAPVRDAGRYVCLHSCGCVAGLFDDLIEIGLNLFNPFQPEVMDVFALQKRYHGRLSFHGGMSIQKVLPFGSIKDVRTMVQRLIDVGREGGYIFSPSHTVPPDVPPENLAAMMDVLRSQGGYKG